MATDDKLTTSDLRRKAESELEKRSQPPAVFPPDDAQALIHELRTHQIELELQNDALRAAEAELVEARDRYSDLYNFSPVGYATLSDKLIILEANLTLASMLGIETSRLIGSPFSALVAAEDQDIFHRHHRRLIAPDDKQAVELRLKRHNGDTFWVRLESAVAAGKNTQIRQLLIAVSDISIHKRDELAVARERERAQSFLDIAGTMLIAIDREQRITLANQKACKTLGFAEAEMIGKNWFEHFLPPDIREATQQIFKQMLRGEIDAVEFHENPVQAKNGQQRLIAWHNRLIRDEEGTICGILTSGEDITERKRAEERAFELIQAIEQSGESIIITDIAGNIEYVNRAFTQVTGYSPEEALGKNPRMLHSGRQNRTFYDQMWSEIVAHGEWSGKLWNRRKNGEIYPEHLHINAIRDTDGKITHFCGLFSDITEQVSLEQQLLQSQKMEAVGTLVGGIAHDFNNMLGAITSNLYLAKTDAKPLPKVADRIESVETQCFRAADMISQLLTFARKGSVKIQAFDLAAFIRESIKLIRVSIPENIRFEQNICDERLMIRGDETQIQQIAMNLVGNARDAVAFAKNPCITATLNSFQPDHLFFTRHPELNGNGFAHLSISDNGYGIPAANIKHLFEPYFTTKEVGKGTGLGLAMVFGAMQTHNGAIEVESRVNEGTTVHIYLPLHEGRETEAESGQESIDAGQGETILLVDDEPSVRDATAEVLTAIGYHVITADNGREALALFEQHLGKIDLAILDIVMPDMGGFEAAKLMRKLDQRLPVIFYSGYDLSHVLNKAEAIPNSLKLCKPVQIQLLHRSIRALLSG